MAFLIYEMLAGLAGAAVGAVLGTLALYAALALVRGTQDAGRRGLLAGALGIIPGMVLGCSVGIWLACVERHSPWWWVAHALVSLAVSLLAGTVGLVLGTGWAEDRGISNYAGERAAWGLFYVALPIALLFGVATSLLVCFEAA